MSRVATQVLGSLALTSGLWFFKRLFKRYSHNHERWQCLVYHAAVGSGSHHRRRCTCDRQWRMVVEMQEAEGEGQPKRVRRRDSRLKAALLLARASAHGQNSRNVSLWRSCCVGGWWVGRARCYMYLCCVGTIVAVGGARAGVDRAGLRARALSVTVSEGAAGGWRWLACSCLAGRVGGRVCPWVVALLRWCAGFVCAFVTAFVFVSCLVCVFPGLG